VVESVGNGGFFEPGHHTTRLVYYTTNTPEPVKILQDSTRYVFLCVQLIHSAHRPVICLSMTTRTIIPQEWLLSSDVCSIFVQISIWLATFSKIGTKRPIF